MQQALNSIYPSTMSTLNVSSKTSNLTHQVKGTNEVSNNNYESSSTTTSHDLNTNSKADEKADIQDVN
jgi:hypothetical protein